MDFFVSFLGQNSLGKPQFHGKLGILARGHLRGSVELLFPFHGEESRDGWDLGRNSGLGWNSKGIGIGISVSFPPIPFQDRPMEFPSQQHIPTLEGVQGIPGILNDLGGLFPPQEFHGFWDSATLQFSLRTPKNSQESESLSSHSNIPTFSWELGTPSNGFPMGITEQIHENQI